MVLDRPGPSPRSPLVVAAVVDSGADRTTFPLDIARDLGIEQHELTFHQNGGRGVRSRFDLWTSSVPVRAGVRRRDPATDTDSAWGPGFVLQPTFIDDDSFLLGRADFFSVFTVTFEEGRGRIFHLDVQVALSTRSGQEMEE
jgi:hypothetical protein